MMILLDGKKLSGKILSGLKKEITDFPQKLRLAAVVVGDHAATNAFIEQKKEAAASVGVNVRVYPFDAAITTNELRKRVAGIVHEKKNTGVVIQLPLPPQINTQYILNAVPTEKDVDALSSRSVGLFATGKSLVAPPVAGAIKALLEEYGVDYQKKYIVVLGAGVLVGRPMALFLLNEKATFSVVRSTTDYPEEFLKKADIIVSGIGKPKFITGDMVKEGAVLVDAGTSESEGRIAGDVDVDSVRSKASFLSPVPGGVGPVTVAILLKNLVILAGQKK